MQFSAYVLQKYSAKLQRYSIGHIDIEQCHTRKYLNCLKTTAVIQSLKQAKASLVMKSYIAFCVGIINYSESSDFLVLFLIYLPTATL